MPVPPEAAQNIRRKLDAGLLPREVVGKMFTGFGHNKRCDGCEMVILANQVLHEFDTPDGRIVRFHLGCAGLWEAERRRRGWLRPSSPSEDDRGSLSREPEE